MLCNSDDEEETPQPPAVRSKRKRLKTTKEAEQTSSPQKKKRKKSKKATETTNNLKDASSRVHKNEEKKTSKKLKKKKKKEKDKKEKKENADVVVLVSSEDEKEDPVEEIGSFSDDDDADTTRAVQRVVASKARSVLSTAAANSKATPASKKRKSPAKKRSKSSSRERGGGDALWVDKYSPTSTSELCLHKAKLKALRDWFVANTGPEAGAHLRSGEPPKRLLIVTGPAGSCKSTAIRLVSEERGIELLTWESEPEAVSDAGSFVGGEYLWSESKMDSFARFVLRANRYPKLQLSGGSSSSSSSSFSSSGDVRNQVMLIEEYPSLGKDAARKNQFNEILLEALQTSRCAIVFVVPSHNEGQADLSEIFDQRVLAHLWTKQLAFNPIAAGIMQKAVARIAKGEKLKMRSSDLKQLVEASRGDLRIAIHSLQFDALGATSALSSSSSSSSSSRAAAETKQFVYGRDKGLNLFHALGKVFHAKLDKELVVADVVDRSGLEPRRFVEFIQQNYVAFLAGASDLEQLADLADAFADSDVLVRASEQRFGDSTTAAPEMLAAELSGGAMAEAKRDLLRGEARRGAAPASGPKITPAAPLSARARVACENNLRLGQALFAGCELTGEEKSGLRSSSAFLPSRLDFQERLPFLPMILSSSSSSSAQRMPPPRAPAALRSLAAVAAQPGPHRTFLYNLCNYSSKHEQRTLQRVADQQRPSFAPAFARRVGRGEDSAALADTSAPLAAALQAEDDIVEF